MRLSTQDVKVYYKLHPRLLFYASQHRDHDAPPETLDDFLDLELDEKMEVRDYLYDHLEIIDSLVEENPFNFSLEELEIIQGWKHAVRGNFFLVKYLKKYAVFLDESDPPRAYGVVSLTDELEDMLGPHLPVFLEAVLLPFKGQIVYDGLLRPYRLLFGGGIRRELHHAYQQAKSMFGIITSLPFSPEENEKGDEEKLRFYLKNKRNRDRYHQEIEDLINKNEKLFTLYHQEMGKIHAREYGKHLRKMGIKEGWFAILEGTIIASGPTHQKARQAVHNLLPKERQKHVYFYHLRRK